MGSKGSSNACERSEREKLGKGALSASGSDAGMANGRERG